MRSWLLATAGINPAVIERLVATLDEEEVDSLDDLRKFAGAAGGRFGGASSAESGGPKPLSFALPPIGGPKASSSHDMPGGCSSKT